MLVVSEIIWVVTSIISGAASNFIHVFAIVIWPSKSIFCPCATNYIKHLLVVLASLFRLRISLNVV